MDLHELTSYFIIYCINCNNINDNIPYELCNACNYTCNDYKECDNIIPQWYQIDIGISRDISTNEVVIKCTNCKKEYIQNRTDKVYKKCEKCRESNKRYKRNRLKNLRSTIDNKKCSVCLKESVNINKYKTCDKCRERNRVHNKIRREKLRQGVNACNNCFKENDSSDYKCCTKCREYFKRYQRNYKK